MAAKYPLLTALALIGCLGVCGLLLAAAERQADLLRSLPCYDSL